MLKIVLAGTLALLAGTAASREDRPAKEQLVAFHASVRVDVDASGQPVSVQAPETLPVVVRSALEQRIARWGFEPARRAGVAMASTTYVMVGACAHPDGDGIRLGVDFKGNGPRLLTPFHRMVPPPYPAEAGRRMAEGAFKVNYAVLPDGSTKVVSVDVEDESEKSLRGHRKTFEKSLMKWAVGLRYEPEQVGGAPVTTQQSVSVVYSVSRRLGKLPVPMRRPEQSQECQEAAGPGLLPVALDSPVKVTPRPAG